MRNLMLAALAGFALFAAGAPAQAKEDMTIQNRSGQSLWITIYDYTHTQQWHGCVKAGQDHTWKPSNVALVFGGGTFLARAEYKANTDCGGKTQYDTHYGSGHLIPAGGTANVMFPPKPTS